MTWTFPPLTGGAGTLRLEFEGFELRAGTPDPTQASKQVLGRWALAWHWDGTGLPAREFTLDQRAPLGRGEVIVESMALAGSDTVVRGRITGFEFDDIPSVTLVATLAPDGAVAVRLSEGRWGYGDDRSNFEFRFPATITSTATFRLETQAAMHAPPGETIPQRVLDADGSGAEITLTVQ